MWTVTVKTLDIVECAEFLKIERTHALKLAGNGTLPGAKIGRAWVFLEEDLAEYLREEVRKQMRARQGEVEAHLVMPLLSVVARRRKKRVVPDLSGYNDDGPPKLLKDR